MKDQDFTTTIRVRKSPSDVFRAINHVRGWWSQNIDGPTDRVGEAFLYHYKDAHTCTIRVDELIEGERVVWHVVDNSFNFIQDPSEWKGNQIVFDIAAAGDATELRFTHVGLVPEYECYDVCAKAWGFFVSDSLRRFIEDGKGDPIEQELPPLEAMPHYTTRISVSQTPQQVFEAICDVSSWWGSIEGSADRLGAIFTFEHQNVHRSTHRVTEFVPGSRIEWTTIDSRIGFVDEKGEWTNTRVLFDIRAKEDGTELLFTHIGLVPKLECYDGCSGAWGFLINESLFERITKGKGQPF